MLFFLSLYNFSTKRNHASIFKYALLSNFSKIIFYLYCVLKRSMFDYPCRFSQKRRKMKKEKTSRKTGIFTQLRYLIFLILFFSCNSVKNKTVGTRNFHRVHLLAFFIRGETFKRFWCSLSYVKLFEIF